MKVLDQVPWPQKQHTACKYFATFTNYLHTNLMSLLTIELHSINKHIPSKKYYIAFYKLVGIFL